MESTGSLWLYFVMVFGVIVLPGMDMAFVLTSALTGGRRAGAVAVAGIAFGGVCHTIAGALGVGFVLKWFPALATAMVVIGTAYLLWLGIALLRVRSSPSRPPLAHRTPSRQRPLTDRQSGRSH